MQVVLNHSPPHVVYCFLLVCFLSPDIREKFFEPLHVCSTPRLPPSCIDSSHVGRRLLASNQNLSSSLRWGDFLTTHSKEQGKSMQDGSRYGVELPMKMVG